MVCMEELMTSALAVFAAIIMKEVLEDTFDYFAPVKNGGGGLRLLMKVVITVIMLMIIIYVSQASG